MQLEVISEFNNIALDYSFVREYAGTEVFRDFFMMLGEGKYHVYVAKSFKMLHNTVVHQSSDKDNVVITALRDLFSLLLGCKSIHQIDAVTSIGFCREAGKIENVCLLTTRNSILFKRMYEQKIQVNYPVAIADGDVLTLYSNSDECYSSIVDVEISPLAFNTSYLDAHVFCNVGDTVLTDKKKMITLNSRVSKGAEGMIFKTEDPRIVAKIYHKGMITPLRWSKLKKMVSLGINAPEICWPQDLLFFNGVPVGYSMRLGKGATLGNILDGPDAVVDAFPDWKRIDVVDALIAVLEKCLYLHLHDIIIGDIQLKNMLLYSSTSVYMIDTDSIQIGNLPCPVGTEEFTPPELWGRNFSGFLRTLTHEDYCIAMLVFSVLFCGLHPYARRNGKETLREEILDRAFPYRLDNSNVEEIPLGGYDHIWEYLPSDLRVMLHDVFALGKRHEAIEWYSAVLSYKEMLLNKKYEDEESYKVFPKMDYKKVEVVETPTKPAYVKGGVSFKDRVIYNPFDAAAGNNSSGASSGSSPFSAPKPRPEPFKPQAQGTKPGTPDPTPTPKKKWPFL